jgi:hypothetical protein
MAMKTGNIHAAPLFKYRFRLAGKSQFSPPDLRYSAAMSSVFRPQSIQKRIVDGIGSPELRPSIRSSSGSAVLPSKPGAAAFSTAATAASSASPRIGTRQP